MEETMDSFRFCAIAGICLAVFLICLPMFSQGSTGRILGIVTDQSGAVIPGVTVIIRDVDRGTARTLTTDEAGAYSAPSLLPGIYTVHVELTGFSTTERPNIRLEVGQDTRIDVQLQAGGQRELVTVQAESPLVDTNNAELGGTIANQAINDLPLNGGTSRTCWICARACRSIPATRVGPTAPTAGGPTTTTSSRTAFTSTSP